MADRILDLTIAGQRIAVPCDVSGQGRDALLLPALSTISSRREMSELAKDLSGEYRCLVPDWPGFGARPRERVPLSPVTFHAFLDGLLTSVPGPYALGVAAGHAAGYLVAAACRHPGLFGRLVLVAPTWRGPLPTAMPDRAAWFPRIRRAVEAPVLGEALYRLNISPPIIRRMMKAHVYGNREAVTPAVVREKHAVTRQRNGRFGTAAFVTGRLDPVASREEFLGLFGAGLPPVLILRPDGAPRRSAAEMDALAASGLARAVRIPGALSPHEEHPAAVAAAIRAA